METNLELLIQLCNQELLDLEYCQQHLKKLQDAWGELSLWMNEHQYCAFTEQIGYKYCDERFGGHIISRVTPISVSDQVKLRAIRMLTSYQKSGVFEFRTPSKEKKFEGITGEIITSYLLYLLEERQLSESTVNNKKFYLYDYYRFLEDRQLSFDEMNVEIMQEFFSAMAYTLASRHNCGSTLKLFFRYSYENLITHHDNSLFVLPDNYNRHSKIPTTYEPEEIKSVISSIERSSAVGKRDYLIILLAAEYGWRTGDITRFSFKDIDWENNTISFNQHKTDIPVIYPLLSSIGNAIIDYLRHGRPETDAKEIIVSFASSNKGQPLSSPTIHSIVSKYMKKAGLCSFETKKHGAHALRHSLATNMLKQNISIPIISTVLGHQNTESTKVYLKIDTNKLKVCPLPIPKIHSIWYKEA